MTWMAVAETAAEEDMIMIATCSLTGNAVSGTVWEARRSLTVEGTGVNPTEKATARQERGRGNAEPV